MCSEYLLRSLTLLRNLDWGDQDTALVGLAIAQANVAHLDAPGGEGVAYADVDRAVPDELRRPVSVLAVSATLGFPYETTRRHVARLLDLGVCVRVRGGLVVQSAQVESPRVRELISANFANVRRLFRSLRTVGVELD